jgi:glycosyltransferase involved in cell wall biosynthesis
MRIAVVGTRGFPDVQGGVETYCEEVYPRVVAHGYTVIAYTRRAYVDARRRSYRGVALVPLRAPRNGYAETIVHTARAVVRAKRDRADLVHFHAIGPSLFVPLAQRLGMRAVVRHVGADYRRDKWPRAARWFLKRCEDIGVTRADVVVCVTDAIAADVRLRYPDANVVRIANGVPHATAERGFAVGERFGLASRRYLLAVGRLVPEKRLRDVIDAFAGLDAPGWKLVVVGAGRAHDRHARALAVRGAAVRGVVMTGALPRATIRELYSNAGGFVLASAHEGLSLALLEALAEDLPCVVSDIAGNRAARLPESWYVPLGDVERLRDGLDHMMTQARAGDAAVTHATRAAVERLPRWDEVAARTLDVFDAVLPVTVRRTASVTVPSPTVGAG